MSGTIVGGELINPGNIEKKLIKAFETWTRFDVNDYFRDQFLEDRWNYDGETERKSGEVVTSPRNIFDLGDLYRSGRDSFSISQGGVDITASWDWDASGIFLCFRKINRNFYFPLLVVKNSVRYGFTR